MVDFKVYEYERDELEERYLNKNAVQMLFLQLKDMHYTLACLNSFLSDSTVADKWLKLPNDEYKSKHNVFADREQRARLVQLQKQVGFFAHCTNFLYDVDDVISDAYAIYPHTVLEPHNRYPKMSKEMICDIFAQHGLNEEEFFPQHAKEEEEAIAV
jgi:hypothetical protein